MTFIADLHVHSKYSRATSKQADLEGYFSWAQVKGIDLLGTGDFTHPEWFAEMKEKLESEGNGFFRLRNEPPTGTAEGIKVQGNDVRFCLSAEISSIYKKNDRVRKVHNLLFAPDFETVSRINARLGAIGNIQSDGRPILGLDSRDLLEIVLEVSDRAVLIPAHVWTPWFSLFGSKSGFDRLEECYEDLSEHIFAFETGLSSDPEMNWRISRNDRYTLISNSDAHSPAKLGREANRFNTDFTYDALFDALKTRKGFLGTFEFFPEEGKYHMDGHRKCGVCLEPEETLKLGGICPECGKKLTVGVLHRVVELADRKESRQPDDAPGFSYLIPLPEIVSEIQGVGVNSKRVKGGYREIIERLGSEFCILNDIPLEDIQQACGPVVSEAIQRMRAAQITPHSGFDGEFGVIRVFNDGELERLAGQAELFPSAIKPGKKYTKKKVSAKKKAAVETANKLPLKKKINSEQKAAVDQDQGIVMVTAGPGTGKTHTLTCWVANLIQKKNVSPDHILAITFTNRAADEMRARLDGGTQSPTNGVRIGTFHSICFDLLKEQYPEIITVYDGQDRLCILRNLFPVLPDSQRRKMAVSLEQAFCSNDEETDANVIQMRDVYQEFVSGNNAVDIADIIPSVVREFRNDPDFLERVRQSITHICVDELQDISPVQAEFLEHIAAAKSLFAIGDPDQSIYGFRGADGRFFDDFQKKMHAQSVHLTKNYRSSATILRAAHAVIRNNPSAERQRITACGKQLAEEKIRVVCARDERDEARKIVRIVEKLVGGVRSSGLAEGEYSFSDIAVLFRLKSVGRVLLAQFKRAGIPVAFGRSSGLISGPPFDFIVDLLRLYKNPADTVSCEKVIAHAVPGLERDTIEILFDNFVTPDAPGSQIIPEGIRTDIAQKIVDLIEFYNKGYPMIQQKGIGAFLESVFEKYIVIPEKDIENSLRRDVIKEQAQAYGKDAAKFLARISLDIHSDTMQAAEQKVRLFTFHAAKGLEFPAVVIAGAEEGVTPLHGEKQDLAEERRLFYVALTRAAEQVIITHAQKRKQYKTVTQAEMSRFVREIPESLLERNLSDKPAPKDVQLELF